MKNGKKIFIIAYLIVVSLFDFMGLGIVVTVFPKLLLDPSLHLLSSTWTSTAKLAILGVMLAIYPLGQFMGAAVFGKLSDVHGRKKLLLITLSGTLFGFFISAVAIDLHSCLGLFIGRLITGFSAGNVAIAQASITDISEDSTKGRNISLLQLVLGVAWVIGPPLGGILSDASLVHWFNFATPFWFMTILLLLILCLTPWLFSETIVKGMNHQTKFTGLLGNVKQMRLFLKSNTIKIGLFSWGVFVCGWWLFEAYLPTYLLQELRFSPVKIGEFLGIMGATYTISQCVVMYSMKWFNPKKMVIYSLFISGISVIFLPYIAFDGGWLHIFITAYVISMAFAIPGLITTISNLTGREDQGQMMGLISSIQALATVSMMLLGGPLEAISQKITIVGGGVLLVSGWALFACYFLRFSQNKGNNLKLSFIKQEEII